MFSDASRGQGRGHGRGGGDGESWRLGDEEDDEEEGDEGEGAMERRARSSTEVREAVASHAALLRAGIESRDSAKLERAVALAEGFLEDQV